MAVGHLEASARRELGGTLLNLQGEINGFGQEAPDAY
jgi:hypothetical protein